jgi:hypothetical protein
MKRPQAIKFWKELRDSTDIGEVISRFENKKGYRGRRTLERYGQADNCFREGLPSEDVARKTSWSVKYVGKIRGWWTDEFGAGTSVAVEEGEEATREPILDVGGSCSAPPDDVGVALLKSWGIGSGLAAETLASWRADHGRGEHTHCALMRQFAEDMRNGVPVKVAKTLLALEEWGERHGVTRAHELAERARLYRSWEGRANHEAFMKEARSILEGGAAAQQ